MRLYHAYNAFRLCCGLSVLLLIVSISSLCGPANHKEYFHDLQNHFNEKHCPLKADATSLFSLIESSSVPRLTLNRNDKSGQIFTSVTPLKKTNGVRNRVVHVSTFVCTQVNISDFRLFLSGNGEDTARTSHLMIFEWVSGMLIIWAAILLIVHWAFYSNFNEFWSYLFTLIEFFMWNIAFNLTLLMHWRWYNIWTPIDHFHFHLPHQILLIEAICFIVMITLMYVLMCPDGVEYRSLRLKSTHRSFDLIENEAVGGNRHSEALPSVSTISSNSQISAPPPPVLRKMAPIASNGAQNNRRVKLPPMVSISQKRVEEHRLLPKGTQPPIIRRNPSKRSVLSYGSARTAISLRNAPPPLPRSLPNTQYQNSTSTNSNPPYPMDNNANPAGEIGWRVPNWAENPEHRQIVGRGPTNDVEYRGNLANANGMIRISGNSLASSGGEPDFTSQFIPEFSAMNSKNNVQETGRRSALSAGNLDHRPIGGAGFTNNNDLHKNRYNLPNTSGMIRTSGNSLASSGGEPDFTSRSGPDFTTETTHGSGGSGPVDQVYFYHHRQ